MKKYLAPLTILLLAAIFFIFLGKMLAPGSYANAELYDFDQDEATVVAAVEKFRTENPEYKLPEDLGLLEGRVDANDHWYHLYLYYRDENQIVHIWVRQSVEGGCVLALEAVSEGLTLGTWRQVNADFGFFENRRVIKTFETRILGPIYSILEHSQP